MIRTAKESDIPLLIDSMRQLIAHVQATTKDTYMVDISLPDIEKLTDMFEQELDDSNIKILLSEHDDNYAGFIYGKITSPFVPTLTIKHVGLIEMCWVETAYRHKGIARKLSQGIEAWFKEKNIKYVDLNYLVGNSEAEASWDKLGYKPFRVNARKELK